jgi:hypothetical protein
VDYGRDEGQHVDEGAQGEDGRIAGKRRKQGVEEEGAKKREKREDAAGKVGLCGNMRDLLRIQRLRARRKAP